LFFNAFLTAAQNRIGPHFYQFVKFVFHVFLPHIVAISTLVVLISFSNRTP
jgi:hypothetical protein